MPSKRDGMQPYHSGVLYGLAALIGGLLLALLSLTLTGHAGTGAADSTPGPTPTAKLPACSPLEGTTLDSMQRAENWTLHSGSDAISVSLRSIYTPAELRSLQIRYHLSTTAGLPENWVQIRREFTQPVTLPAGAHLRVWHRGTAANSLQIGLVTADERIYFGTDLNSATHTPWWTYATWDVRDLRSGTDVFSTTQPIRALFFSIKKSAPGDVGGLGTLTLDSLAVVDMAHRPTLPVPEELDVPPEVPERAAGWIARQQRDSGLVRSWQEETAENAWLYDQALALIVLCESGQGDRARQLAGALHALQLPNGAWHAGYDAGTEAPIDPTQPVGAVAWTVYALSDYARRCGDPTAYRDAVQGAGWLAALQRADGSLPALPDEPPHAPAPTEPNLDAWWAFRAAGHPAEAERLKTYLLTKVWDEDLGRFKASPASYPIFLDNQTWGASFLRANYLHDDADRALSYARWTLVSRSSDHLQCGYDGAGPFSVWNEGTLQYIVARGPQSERYWPSVVYQQADDGGMPGSRDNLTGYVVWLTRWHGVAPTAWLYFAATGGPFYPERVYLPLAIR